MKTKRKNPSSSKRNQHAAAVRRLKKFLTDPASFIGKKGYDKVISASKSSIFGPGHPAYKSKTPLDVVINRSIDEEVAKQCNATPSKTAEPQDCDTKKLADAIRRQGPWETKTVVLGDEINSELDQHIAMAHAMAENSVSDLESNYSKGLRIAYKISKQIITRHLLAFIQKSGSTITITCDGQAKTFVHKTLDT